jgi:type II secretion system protein G
MSRVSLRGFTLIELLIVVAIIAILAAIAIPNMLEAQVRSKVSRALADMKSLQTAIEAYRVDENKYPPDGDDAIFPNPLTAFSAHQRLSVLTSPIAYVSSLPPDPFHLHFDPNPPVVYLFPEPEPPYTYAYNTWGSYAGGQGQPAHGGNPDNYNFLSLGPSKQFDSIRGRLAYDPTNGTLSPGDIFVFGGNVVNMGR